jgi:mitochondrial import receptor subunit TOM20
LFSHQEGRHQLTSNRAAYAVYFDYRRRNDIEFRRALRRNEKKQARAEKDQAVAAAEAQRHAIKRAVDEAKEEGFPTDPDGKEAYFLEQVQNGELLGADREFAPEFCHFETRGLISFVCSHQGR